MKHLLPVLALLAAPHFALAEPTTAPPKPATPLTKKAAPSGLPDAQDLLDHLFAPYEAAKTYRGTFDVDVSSKDPKNPSPFSSIHIESLYRYNTRGDKSGEVTTFSVTGKKAGKDATQTLHVVDDGVTTHLLYVEQKAWHMAEREPLPTLRMLLQPILEQSAQSINQDPTFELAISNGVDAGRKVYVLLNKGDQDFLFFRAVVDAQTRALRSLSFSGDLGGLSIHGSNQTFDPPVSDKDFKWTVPAGFRSVKEGSIPLPSFLTPTKR